MLIKHDPQSFYLSGRNFLQKIILSLVGSQYWTTELNREGFVFNSLWSQKKTIIKWNEVSTIDLSGGTINKSDVIEEIHRKILTETDKAILNRSFSIFILSEKPICDRVRYLFGKAWCWGDNIVQIRYISHVEGPKILDEIKKLSQPHEIKFDQIILPDY